MLFSTLLVLVPYYVLFSALMCLHVIKLVLVSNYPIRFRGHDFDSNCTSSWSLYTFFTLEWSNIYS